MGQGFFLAKLLALGPWLLTENRDFAPNIGSLYSSIRPRKVNILARPENLKSIISLPTKPNKVLGGRASSAGLTQMSASPSVPFDPSLTKKKSKNKKKKKRQLPPSASSKPASVPKSSADVPSSLSKKVRAMRSAQELCDDKLSERFHGKLMHVADNYIHNFAAADSAAISSRHNVINKGARGAK